MTNSEWDDNEFPLEYLITFRTFGTWLHGDERGSMDRHGKNIFGAERIAPNSNFRRLMRENTSINEFLLGGPQRKVVEQAIRNVCALREYALSAINVRTNHAHSVVSARIKPELIRNAFKANATRELRAVGLVSGDQVVW